MTEIHWRGVLPALMAKFAADDRIDRDAMERHLAVQPDAGLHGIMVPGSPGEALWAQAALASGHRVCD